MNEEQWHDKVIAYSDSNAGYALTARWVVRADGTASGLWFDLETYGEAISFGYEEMKRFKKKMRRAEKRHAERYNVVAE